MVAEEVDSLADHLVGLQGDPGVVEVLVEHIVHLVPLIRRTHLAIMMIDSIVGYYVDSVLGAPDGQWIHDIHQAQRVGRTGFEVILRPLAMGGVTYCCPPRPFSCGCVL